MIAPFLKKPEETNARLPTTVNQCRVVDRDPCTIIFVKVTRDRYRAEIEGRNVPTENNPKDFSAKKTRSDTRHIKRQVRPRFFSPKTKHRQTRAIRSGFAPTGAPFIIQRMTITRTTPISNAISDYPKIHGPRKSLILSNR